LAVALIAGEAGKPQQIHRGDGVGRRRGSVEDLPGPQDEAVVALRGEEVAAGGIEEQPVELALQLEGRAEVRRLEGRLVEVEKRLDEVRVIGGEPGNSGLAVLLAVEELTV